MNNVATRINSLSPKQLALLSQRLAEKAAGNARQATIRRHRADTSYPLSHEQQRLWFLDQLEPGGVQYIIPAAARLQGVLNISVLEQAFTEVVRRHEVLRTRFAVEAGRPRQVVEPAQAFSLPIIDLSGLADVEAQARRLIEAEARRPFDLARGPLLRATVLRLAAEDHVLVITMHHIISDGWSMSVLTREVQTLYRSFLEARSLPLAELPIQYADYALWQREALTIEVIDKDLDYWKQKLSGNLPTLELPADRRRPAVQTHRGATQSLKLPKELSEKLKELSRAEGITPFILLLAAFKTLLFQYSGQEDVIIGTPMSGRNCVETEALIGFFANTLVLRTDLSGDPPFLELLRRVRDVVLEAHQHQHVAFEKLVDELGVERSLSHTPLFQSMFMFENALETAPELPGLRLGQMGFNSSANARTDLDLYMWEATGELQGSFVYDTDLFDAATISRLSDRFGDLLFNIAEQPSAVLSDLRSESEFALPPIPATLAESLSSTEEKEFPLSYHQERLWFIDQFETGNVYESAPVYHNIPLIIHLSGALDTSRLESSLNTVIARHAVLRTRIITENDQGRQVVIPSESLRLKVVELDEAESRAIELAIEEACQPFALDHEPPVRATLWRMGTKEAVLAISIHHIVADSTSLRLIAAELAEIYDAQSTGRSPQLPELPLQYADYVAWQRSLTHEALEPMLFYWKWQLRGRLPALELPEDRPRPAVHTYTAARRRFSLREGVLQRIQALGEAEGTRPFAVLLAAFKTLLGRYARQEEIVVGTSAPCRNQPGTEHLVGPLANLLVLRSTLSGNPTFRTLLARVEKTIARARAHQEMPFDKLVLELHPEKDMSRTALFDVLFVFDDEEPLDHRWGGLHAQLIETNLGYGKYDLNLSLQSRGGELQGTLVYNSDIYDEFTIQQMIGHFETIIEVMISELDQHIDDFILLSRDEEERQLVTWNSTQADYPAEKTIHQLFEEQARRTPNKTAVVFEATQLTYRELDEQANRLAHYLRKQGVGPDMLVALRLEKSVEMMVAILGVLKSGGAYLPIDPTCPEERFHFMLKDSGAAHLVTTTGLAQSATEHVDSTILLDQDWEAIKAQPSAPPEQSSGPRNVAYCIYTSGSTGKPKGVLIEHRNVVRLMVNDKLQFSFVERDVWTMFHSYAFDFSVWEMYGALLYGGTLVVIPEHVMKDPALFFELLVKHRVTVLNQTPTAFYNLSREVLAHPDAELALRYVIFGGEALQPVQLREWNETYPAIKLINMYGITETTVHVTFREISSREIRENVSNIGVPIPTTTTYIMDHRLRLLPVGVPGEICVGGEGVSRGYLKRDELTREKFVVNPYRQHERIYRSGDLAKLLSTGEMVYLGRIDDQVQLRGFRVELGEIRGRLLEHAQVSDSEILAVKNETGTSELVAYVVTRGELTVTALRNHLSEALPYYMVPSAFVLLDKLPLTPNGKIDRAALPPPDRMRPEMEATYVAPRNRIEEVLAAVWAEVLKLERVGVNDNFFELGGDSIISIQIIARANQSGLHLSTKQLFLHQTIAKLALVVDTGKNGESKQAEIEEVVLPFSLVSTDQQKIDELTGGDREIEDVYPLSPMQQGMLFSSAYSPRAGAYLAQTVCTLPGNLNVPALRRACRQVIDRHEVLRTAFVWEQMPEPLQVVHKHVDAPWQQEDWRSFSAAEQDQRLKMFLREDQERGFDLSKAPLLRFALFQTADDSYRLIWTSHHLLLDGWSGPLVLREVFEFYAAFAQGKEGLERERPRPFREYIAWLQRQDMSQAESFWRRKLEGFKAPTPFGIDVPPSESPNTEAVYLESRIALSPETSAAMQALARQHKLTLNTLTQGAWALLLSRYSGNEDVVFGTTVSGRPAELPGVETMVGLFINTLPVRVRVKDNDSLLPWLENLQSEQAELRQYDYSSLVQIQGWSEVPRSQPVFESNLVFFNLPEATPGKSDENAASREAKSGLISRDLSVESKTPTDIPLTIKSIPGAIMQLEILYDNRRFAASTITRVLDQWRALVESMIANPHSNLETFKNMLNKLEAEEKITARDQRKESNLKRFMNARPKSVTVARENLIKTSCLRQGEMLPLVVQPGVADLDLSNWAKHNLSFIENKLLEHGGILFRGFDVDSIAKFNQFTLSISPEQLEYVDQHTPRTRVAGKIYTSTEYPAEHYVPFHSENSKNHVWPMKIWFHCVQPALQGGETPIADNRKVFELLDPKIKERFMQKNVMYVRNFGEGLGVPWQTVFQTNERPVLEAYFRDAGVEFEWKDATRLRIRHVAQAVATHPVTGKTVWFNQAHLFHVSSLEPAARQSLLSLFTEQELPSNAYFGDGSPIDDSIIEEIREVFRQCSVSFPWQQKDILMLDNMSIAHGRAPYLGPRKIVVAMAEAHGRV